MFSLSVDEMREVFKNRQAIRATSADRAFSVILDEYVPFVTTAVHDGGNFRKKLRPKCFLNRFERWYEEDPLTQSFISSLPIQLVGNDSRYEYDLNRKPEKCIYDTAWGKTVWKAELSEEDRQQSIVKHSSFYDALECLLRVLVEEFEYVVLYDVHSYNYKRIKDKVCPVFNLGSEQISEDFREDMDDWLAELKRIKIPHHRTTVEENSVFRGQGYLAEFVSARFPTVLVLPTEVKKIYVDELSADQYPAIISAIREGLKTAILNHAHKFTKKRSKYSAKRKHQMLSSGIEGSVLDVDAAIGKIAKSVEVLEFVNPANIEAAKSAFFKSKYRVTPVFRYKPIKIDIAAAKRALYSLDLGQIRDVSIQELYHSIADSKARELDLMHSRDTREFLYHSLLHYGEPSELDLSNARFLIHCEEFDRDETEDLSAEQAQQYLSALMNEYGFEKTVKVAKDTAARAVFSPEKFVLKIRKGAVFKRSELLALGHHEIGVHMLTSINAHKQKLEFLRYGMPGDTECQEGLAVLMEYLSGGLSVQRLRLLGMRVLGVKAMLCGDSFPQVFSKLVEEYGTSHEAAFYVTARIFRGGGFTKDYLYLKGFSRVLELHSAKVNLSPLFIGKTSYNFLPILKELIDRKGLSSPTTLPLPLKSPAEPDKRLAYIVRSIKN